MSGGDYTLIHGDCVEAMRAMEAGSVDLVLTDPPYGTTGAGTNGNDGYGRRLLDGTRRSIANDADLSALTTAAPLIARALAPSGIALVFMAPTNYRAACAILEDASLRVWWSLPWDKGAPGISYRTRFAFEDCILATHPGCDPFTTRGPIVVPLRVPRVQKPEHPNEKPVELLRRYMRWALPEPGVVLDPFAGIASCGVAALLEGHKYIGMEIDPQWWPAAERRLAEVRDNEHGLPLFGGAA